MGIQWGLVLIKLGQSIGTPIIRLATALWVLGFGMGIQGASAQGVAASRASSIAGQAPAMALPGGGGPADVDWDRAVVAADRRECGQGCLYAHANEVVSTQLSYDLNQFNQLEQAHQTYLNSGKASKEADFQAVLDRHLGGYCYRESTRGQDGQVVAPVESAEACYGRYRAYQIQQMAFSRRGLVQNRAMVGRLKDSVRFRQVGTTGFKPVEETFEFNLAVKDAAGSKKVRQIPLIPTVEEVRTKYRAEIDRAKILNSQSFVDWANQEPFRPAESDYALFDGEKLVSSCDGKTGCACRAGVCFDTAAFKAAVKRYSIQKRIFDREKMSLLANFERARQAGNPTLGLPSVGLPTDLRTENQRTFLAARKRLAEKAAELIEGKKSNSSNQVVSDKPSSLSESDVQYVPTATALVKSQTFPGASATPGGALAPQEKEIVVKDLSENQHQNSLSVVYDERALEEELDLIQ